MLLNVILINFPNILNILFISIENIFFEINYTYDNIHTVIKCYKSMQIRFNLVITLDVINIKYTFAIKQIKLQNFTLQNNYSYTYLPNIYL